MTDPDGPRPEGDELGPVHDDLELRLWLFAEAGHVEVTPVEEVVARAARQEVAERRLRRRHARSAAAVVAGVAAAVAGIALALLNPAGTSTDLATGGGQAAQTSVAPSSTSTTAPAAGPPTEGLPGGPPPTVPGEAVATPSGPGAVVPDPEVDVRPGPVPTTTTVPSDPGRPTTPTTAPPPTVPADLWDRAEVHFGPRFAGATVHDVYVKSGGDAPGMFLGALVHLVDWSLAELEQAEATLGAKGVAVETRIDIPGNVVVVTVLDPGDRAEVAAAIGGDPRYRMG